MQSINFFLKPSDRSHKVGSHKFDKSQLSLASSHKLVMTFVSGQNIKFSFWTSLFSFYNIDKVPPIFILQI